ncbi:hypothetical protein [Janibacter sp. G1551]|uniref:hypothetical protein n=1 Tax=Janibacter sp. G1551 TaxID=3420440 RepID=UPI003D04FD39
MVKPRDNTHDGTHDDIHDDEGRTPEQIAELFAIAGREIEAIEQLTGCVAQLHEVQAAKAKPATLTPAEVRAALEFRRAGLGEAQ